LFVEMFMATEASWAMACGLPITEGAI
jgi:hypothetical protein